MRSGLGLGLGLGLTWRRLAVLGRSAHGSQPAAGCAGLKANGIPSAKSTSRPEMQPTCLGLGLGLGLLGLGLG